jgi:hypothetical protein
MWRFRHILLARTRKDKKAKQFRQLPLAFIECIARDQATTGA